MGVEDEFYGSGAPSSSGWFDLYRQWKANQDTITALRGEQRNIDNSPQATGSASDIATALLAKTQARANVNGTITSLRQENDSLIKRMASIDPEQTYTLFPDRPDLVNDSIKEMKALFGGGGSGGGAHYSFQIGPGGQVVRTNSASGTVEIVDTIPELAQKRIEVITSNRDGHAYAIDLDHPSAPRIDLGSVGYAEVDPAVKFKTEVLIGAANVQATLAGVELQRRGMIVSAIGTDLANQIQLGRLTLEEANLNLNRIDSALTQRREERAQLLNYGVTQASLRTNAAGETVTRLPFGEQIATILTSATGRNIGAENFDLGVTYINPEQAGQDVLNGSAYTSPVPGLTQQAQQARDMISTIVNAPAGNSAVTEALVRAAGG